VWGRPAPPLPAKRLWRLAKLGRETGAPALAATGRKPLVRRVVRVAVPAMARAHLPQLANARRARWPPASNTLAPPRAPGLRCPRVDHWGPNRRRAAALPVRHRLGLEPVAAEHPRSARSAWPGPSSPTWPEPPSMAPSRRLQVAQGLPQATARQQTPGAPLVGQGGRYGLGEGSHPSIELPGAKARTPYWRRSPRAVSPSLDSHKPGSDAGPSGPIPMGSLRFPCSG